jgi:hypothetical protein
MESLSDALGHVSEGPEKARQYLIDYVHELGEKATELCQQHFNLVMDGNKQKSWNDKSVLFVQTRIRGYSLTVNWYEIRWYGSKSAKTRRMTKRLIPKQKSGYGYNLAVLGKLAQPWEMGVIEAIEPKLSEIRRRVYLINKAITSINHVARGAQQI